MSASIRFNLFGAVFWFVNVISYFCEILKKLLYVKDFTD
jgi:hypothetical protein